MTVTNIEADKDEQWWKSEDGGERPNLVPEQIGVDEHGRAVFKRVETPTRMILEDGTILQIG